MAFPPSFQRKLRPRGMKSLNFQPPSYKPIYIYLPSILPPMSENHVPSLQRPESLSLCPGFRVFHTPPPPTPQGFLWVFAPPTSSLFLAPSMCKLPHHQKSVTKSNLPQACATYSGMFSACLSSLRPECSASNAGKVCS